MRPVGGSLYRHTASLLAPHALLFQHFPTSLHHTTKRGASATSHVHMTS